MMAPTNRLTDLVRLNPGVEAALSSIQAGDVVEVSAEQNAQADNSFGAAAALCYTSNRFSPTAYAVRTASALEPFPETAGVNPDEMRLMDRLAAPPGRSGFRRPSRAVPNGEFLGDRPLKSPGDPSLRPSPTETIGDQRESASSNPKRSAKRKSSDVHRRQTT